MHERKKSTSPQSPKWMEDLIFHAALRIAENGALHNTIVSGERV
jgi:hypothetical protein